MRALPRRACASARAIDGYDYVAMRKIAVLIPLLTLAFGSACTPAINVLDADLSRGVPQTRPVPPQAFINAAPAKKAPEPVASLDEKLEEQTAQR